jgi:hypothetical protein
MRNLFSQLHFHLHRTFQYLNVEFFFYGAWKSYFLTVFNSMMFRSEQERLTDLPNKSMSPTPSEFSVASSGKQSTQPKQSEAATSSKKLASTKKPLPVADDKSIST